MTAQTTQIVQATTTASSTPARTLFINAHIATGQPGSTVAQTAPLQDILAENGRIAAIGEGLASTLAAQGYNMADVEVVDLGGKLVCPPFCDTHLHLDYVFTARKPGAVNESGTLFEGIQRWSDTKSDLTVDEIKSRARKAIAMELRHGVQYIRSHADVTDPNLTSLKALLELKEELKDVVTIQIVSFPQEGMYSYEGPHGESGAELVEEGLRMGLIALAASHTSSNAVNSAKNPCTPSLNSPANTTSSLMCIATKPTIRTHAMSSCSVPWPTVRALASVLPPATRALWAPPTTPTSST